MRVDLPRGIQVTPILRPDGGVTVDARIPLGREVVRLGVDFSPESVRRARQEMVKVIKNNVHLRDDNGNDVTAAAWVKAVLGNALQKPGMPALDRPMPTPTPELVQAVTEVANGRPSGKVPQRAYDLAVRALQLRDAASKGDVGALEESARIEDGVSRGWLPCVEQAMADDALCSLWGPREVFGACDWIGCYPPDAQDAIGAIARARRGLDPMAMRKAMLAFGQMLHR